MYFIIIWRNDAAPPVVDCVCETWDEASQRYEEAIDDPLNGGCWIEIAVRRIRQFRQHD